MILIKEIPSQDGMIKVGIYDGDSLLGFSEWSKKSDQDLKRSQHVTATMEDLSLTTEKQSLVDGLLRGSLNILRRQGFHHCLICEPHWDKLQWYFQSKDYCSLEIRGCKCSEISISEFFNTPCKGMKP